MSSAADMAAEFEKDGGPEFIAKGKRSKTDRVEHKHDHPEGDSRKIVQNAINGENKRKDAPAK